MATVTPETMAEFSSAFEQIMGDSAVDDLSGYTVETFGRSARAASAGIEPATFPALHLFLKPLRFYYTIVYS
jgi:hypothetical protein